MTAASPSCKYTARLERDGDRYVVEIPNREIDLGSLSPGDVCQVTVDLLEHGSEEDAAGGAPADEDGAPVTVGQRLTVEIDDVGQQDDGIARVGQGYVLIVPGSDVGDEVDVEVQHTNPTYGFAEILSGKADESDPNGEGNKSKTDDGETGDEVDETATEAGPTGTVE